MLYLLENADCPYAVIGKQAQYCEAAPGAPGALSATPGSGQISLTWTAASGATGHHVHRGTASGGPYTTIQSNLPGTSYTDTGLANGTTYYYVVTGDQRPGRGAASRTRRRPRRWRAANRRDLHLRRRPGRLGAGVERDLQRRRLASMPPPRATSALRVGDANQDRQYKIGGLVRHLVDPRRRHHPFGDPAAAPRHVSGTNPFTTHGTCWADVQTGGFSGSTTLQTGDFQAAATAVQAASLSNAATNGAWSEGSLNAAGLAALDKTGTTQLRVYFNLDDNDDTATTTSATTPATTRPRPTGRSWW